MGTPKRRLKLQTVRPGIHWEKWERRLYYAILKNGQPPPLVMGLDPSTVVEPAGPFDALYFEHCAQPEVQQRLAEDEAALEAFARALGENEGELEGKTVLEIGSGTGLLAMLAAQAGAKHVYAVEASSLADTAQQVVRDNQLQHKVTVIKGRVEDVQLPAAKVDVILCNWMGPALLGGGMLDSVATARRRFLAPGGVVLPDKAELFVVGVEDRDHLSDTKQFWSDVAGFDLRAVLPAAVRLARRDDMASTSRLVTAPQRLLSFDVASARAPAAIFRRPFELSVQRSDRLHALALYWDVTFSFAGKADSPVVLSTSPGADPTHWGQTLLSFPRGIRVAPGEALKGVIECQPAELNPRDLDLDLQVEYQGVHARAKYMVKGW